MSTDVKKTAVSHVRWRHVRLKAPHIILTLSDCATDVITWHAAKRLQLNADKMELMWPGCQTQKDSTCHQYYSCPPSMCNQRLLSVTLEFWSMLNCRCGNTCHEQHRCASVISAISDPYVGSSVATFHAPAVKLFDLVLVDYDYD